MANYLPVFTCIPGLFCFMRSHLEALEHARAEGKWILYFRFE